MSTLAIVGCVVGGIAVVFGLVFLYGCCKHSSQEYGNE